MSYKLRPRKTRSNSCKNGRNRKLNLEEKNDVLLIEDSPVHNCLTSTSPQEKLKYWLNGFDNSAPSYSEPVELLNSKSFKARKHHNLSNLKKTELHTTPKFLRNSSLVNNGSDTSTPNSQGSLAAQTVDEDLFGFEKLLHEKPKQKLSLDLNASPICPPNFLNKENTSSTSDEDALNKTEHFEKVVSPDVKNKKVLKKKRTKEKCMKRVETNTEIHLFGEGDSFDTDFSTKIKKKKKDPASKAKRKKRPTSIPKNVPPIVPDIPWKEIMEHELVIE